MAQVKYQNVRSCRFFIDYFQYALTVGSITADDIYTSWGATTEESVGLFHLNPSKVITIPTAGINNEVGVYSYRQIMIPTDFYYGMSLWNFNYTMLLSHNLTKSNCMFYAEAHTGEGGGYSGFTDVVPQFNYINSRTVPELNGWSYYTHGMPQFGGDEYAANMQLNIRTDEGHSDTKIGAISVGRYIDLHAPDMSLTLTRSYDGIKSQTSRGGAKLTNYEWMQRPMWQREAWGSNIGDAAGDGTGFYRRVAGRRTWDLQFSYLTTEKIMADIDLINKYGLTDSSGSDYFEVDDSFMAQFMQKSLGGSLKFIFQPNKDDNSPDGFAICTLDQDSIGFKQQAHNLWEISLKIVETW